MKNWKTTLAGLAVALLNLNVQGMTVKAFLYSAAIAALGAAAKDHNTTGGTVQQ